jgi:hypothetical protein
MATALKTQDHATVGPVCNWFELRSSQCQCLLNGHRVVMDRKMLTAIRAPRLGESTYKLSAGWPFSFRCWWEVWDTDSFLTPLSPPQLSGPLKAKCLLVIDHFLLVTTVLCILSPWWKVGGVGASEVIGSGGYVVTTTYGHKGNHNISHLTVIWSSYSFCFRCFLHPSPRCTKHYFLLIWNFVVYN